MQIVIEINDEIYETLKKCEVMTSGLRGGKTFMSKIYSAIANGIPLPKGHGRLIDANYKLSSDGRTVNSVCGYLVPTIIEADKESD